MRENMGLYRGRRTDGKGWAEGSLVKLDAGSGQVYIMEEYPHASTLPKITLMQTLLIPVDPDTVGECTGLPDKNGRLIFEHDIVAHRTQGGLLVDFGVVNWDARNGRWARQLSMLNPCFYLHYPDDYEVVGNIHDAQKTPEPCHEVEIKRKGKHLLTVHIHPIGKSEIKIAHKKATTFAPNPSGRKLPPIKKDFSDQKFMSWLIYLATVEEDQTSVWGDPQTMEEYGLLEPYQTIDHLLTLGEKFRVFDVVQKISGIDLLQKEETP